MLLQRYILVALVFSSPAAWSQSHLKPFYGDGCSYFPDGTSSSPDLWAHCCIIHDYKYWKGDGGHTERTAADAELGVCVNEALEKTNLADPTSLGLLMTCGTHDHGYPVDHTGNDPIVFVANGIAFCPSWKT